MGRDERARKQPVRSICSQDVADGLRGAAHLRGNLGGAFAARAGQQNLAAAELEGIAGAQPPLQPLALRVR